MEVYQDAGDSFAYHTHPVSPRILWKMARIVNRLMSSRPSFGTPQADLGIGLI